MPDMFGKYIKSVIFAIATAMAICVFMPENAQADTADAQNMAEVLDTTDALNEAYDIDVSVDYGYGSDMCAKGGRYLPVTVHMNSHMDSGASGSMQVKVAGADEDIYSYEYPWTLDALEQADTTYYIPLGYSCTGITVTLTGGTGTQEEAPAGLLSVFSASPDADAHEQEIAEIYSQRIDLNIDTDTTGLFIGTLCDDERLLSWLDDEAVDYGLLKTHVYNFDEDDLPDDKRGLDMLDVIIVTDYKLRKLDETRMRAMLGWVRDGGVLILGTGERADDTLGRLAPELLDDRYSSPELRELDISLGTDTDSPSDGIIETMQVTVPLHGGNAIWRDGENTVMSTVRKDGGIIAVASFDITELSSYARSHSGYADRFLTTVLGSKRITQLAGEQRRADDREYEYLNLLINAGDVDKLPPVRLQAVALLAYILLVGPGLYLFLKQHAAGEYYRRGVLVLSLVFAALLYFIGSRTRLEDDLSKYVSVVVSDGESATETTFLNLRALYAGKVEAEAQGGYTVLPISSSTAAATTQTVDDETSDVNITYEDGCVNIAITAAGELTPRFFKLEKTLEEDEAADTVNGSLELFEGKLSGTLINSSGQALTGAVIIGYGKIYYIGGMEAGETRVLTDVDMMNVPLSDSYNVAKSVFGDDEYEKTGILTFLRECYFEGYSTDLRVVALARDDVNTMIRTDVRCTGNKVFVSAIPTDRYRDGMICRPASIDTPTLVSGYYDEAGNTMYTDEETVLEYSLGEDIEPTALYIEPVEDGFAAFDGVMYWYNLESAVYEPIPAQSGLVTDEAFAAHISSDHKVTIRYVYTGDRKNLFEVSLPMISVIGKER